MKESLKKEIEKMINRKVMRFDVYESPYTGRYEAYDLHEIIDLILQHLEMKPHTECKYPRVVLKSTKND